MPLRTKETRKLVVAVDGPLVAESRVELRSVAFGALDRGINLIVFDMRGCHYIDSAALATLITISQRARQAKARVRFRRVVPEIYALFGLTHLLTLLDVRAD